MPPPKPSRPADRLPPVSNPPPAELLPGLQKLDSNSRELVLGTFRRVFEIFELREQRIVDTLNARDTAHTATVKALETRLAELEERADSLRTGLRDSVTEDVKILQHVAEYQRTIVAQARDAAVIAMRAERDQERKLAEIEAAEKEGEAGARAGGRVGAKWAAITVALGIAAQIVEWLVSR